MADQLVVLRPNALYAAGAAGGSNNMTYANVGTGTATSIIQAIADTNEGGTPDNGKNAYAVTITNTTGFEVLNCGFPTASLPANAVVTRLVPHHTESSTSFGHNITETLFLATKSPNVNLSINSSTNSGIPDLDPPTSLSNPASIYNDTTNVFYSIYHGGTISPLFQTVKIYSVFLDVYYNVAATTVVSVTGLVSGIVTTTTPTFTWTYVDPEGDTLQATQIAVWKTTDTTVSGFDPFITTGAAWTTTLSGSTTVITVPNGTLQIGTPYKVYTRCADIYYVGALRYGPASTGVAFNVITDPLAAASVTLPTARTSTYGFTGSAIFDSTTGIIGPVYVRYRPNLLSPYNASGETADGLTGVGQWLNNSGSNGSATFQLITSSIGYAGTAHFRSISTATTTRMGGQNVSIGTLPGQFYNVTPGNLIHIQGRLHPASIRRLGGIRLGFYTAGLVQVANSLSTEHTEYNSSSVWTTVSLWARVPVGATVLSIEYLWAIPSVVEAHDSDGWQVTEWGWNEFTNSNMSIAKNSPLFPVYWQNVSGGTGTAAYTTVPTPTVAGGVTSSNNCMDLASHGPAGVGSNYGAFGTTEAFATKTRKVIVSAAFRYVNDFANAPATGSARIASIDDVTNILISTITGLPANQWVRKAVLFDFTAASADANVFNFYADNIPANMHVLVTDVMCEPVFTFANGNMETGTSFPFVTTLGDTTATTTIFTPTVPNWSQENDVAGTVITSDASVFHSGTRSMKWTIPNTETTTYHRVSQYITVAGMTSIGVDFWMRYANTTVGASLQFYDSAGVNLIDPGSAVPLLTTSGTSGGVFLHTTSPTYPIPANCSYVNLAFNVVGSLDGTTSGIGYLDDVTVTLTGSYGVGSTYVTGGYTYAGPSAIHTGSDYEIDLGLERSTDLVTWTRARGPDNTTDYQTAQTNVLVNSTGPATVTFTADNEWPLQSASASNQTIYYRGVAQIGDPGSSGITNTVLAPSSVPVALTRSLNIDDWWLIDPTRAVAFTDAEQANAIKVGVKKFHSETTEQAGTFTPIGRTRKVIVSSGVMGETINLDIQTVSHADYIDLNLAINSANTFLLRSPDGLQWWVRPVKRTRDRVWTGSYVRNPLRITQVTFEEVDAVI